MLTGRATAPAKSADGPVEMLRMFKLAQTLGGQMPGPRRSTSSRLSSSQPTPSLRDELTGLSNPVMLIRHCAGLDDP